MPKLCKQCPHGHRAGSNSQRKCHKCDHRFYKRRHSPKMKYTMKCPLCNTCVGGNNTKTCKKCGHMFQKRNKQMEDEIDFFLEELASTSGWTPILDDIDVVEYLTELSPGIMV
jgi:hypothetical protein